MKKILVALMLVGFALSANAGGPTLYGKINKEIRMYDEDGQPDATNYGIFEDVEGSPSRFGFKGDYQFGDMKVKYVMEAKFSTQANGIDTRLASIALVNNWGTITVGQDYTATSKLGNKLDPLANTGAALNGSTMGVETREATKYVGHLYRSRKDVVKYESPKFMGFQLLTSYDRNDTETRDKVTPHYWEKAVAYGHDFGTFKLDVWAGMITWSAVNDDENTVMRYAARAGFGDFTFGFLMDDQEEKHKTTGANPSTTDNTRMMLTGKYTMGKFDFAVTYGKHEQEDNNTVSTAQDTKEYSQIAVGVAHNYSKNFQFRLTYAGYDYKEPNAAAAQTPSVQTNSATTIMLGTEIKF
jgi:predicted porin